MTYITSSYWISSSLRRSLNDLQKQLSKTQIEITTGRHADAALALGVNVSRSFSLNGVQDTIQTIRATNNLASIRLDSTQTALTNLLSTAKSMRATLIAAQTDGGEPAAIAAQAKNALTGFISNLNSGDGDNFIFGGIKTNAAPIENYFAEPAPANKAALDSAFAGAFGFAQSDPAVANITPAQMSAFLSGDFQSLFAPAQWKSTWSQASDEPMKNQISISRSIDASITANEPAMRKLAAAYVMASDIGNERLSQDTRRTVAKTAMETIDSAIALLTQTQARAGVMQATVDSANNAMDVQSTTLRLQLADLEGIDQTEAAARANILMTQIQSAYTLTSRISQLSLTKYL